MIMLILLGVVQFQIMILTKMNTKKNYSWKMMITTFSSVGMSINFVVFQQKTYILALEIVNADIDRLQRIRLEREG